MYKVINSFIDLDSGKKYEVGDEFKPSSVKRGKELANLGFVEKAASGKGDPNESQPAK